MTVQHYFGHDDDPPAPLPSEPPEPIDEISATLRVVRRLADELPAGAHTSRLSVAIEAAQAAAGAHPSRKSSR